MPTYVTPKKNTQFIFYAGLVSQANTKIFQSSPTRASGDFKVSTDGGALANLTTLPTNTPGSQMVKFTLSSSEMNGDNVTVVCSDQAGAEWCDLIVNIQTSARQVDDLAFPETSGRSFAVDTSGVVDANTVKIAGQTASASGTVTFPNATLASTTNITAASGIDVSMINGVSTSSVTTISPFVGSTGAAINGTNANTLSSHDPGATLGTSTLTQAQVTGGTYALNSSSFAFSSAMDFTTAQKAATLARVTLVDTTTTVTGGATSSALASLVSTIGTPAGASISADIAANPDANIAAMKIAFGDGSYVATGAVTSMGAGVITESAFTIPTPTASVPPTGPIGWLNFLFARFGGARVKKNSSALTIATYLPSDSSTVWLSGSYTTTASIDTTDDVAKAS